MNVSGDIQVTVHEMGPFSLRGIMCALPDYKPGDPVLYGGALYEPVVSRSGFSRDGVTYLAFRQSRGKNGPAVEHWAEVWHHKDRGYTFFCS